MPPFYTEFTTLFFTRFLQLDVPSFLHGFYNSLGAETV